MTPNVWDEFKQSDDENPYISFDTIGDRCEGVVIKVGTVTFTDKNGPKTKPQLTIRTREGKERILTVSNIDLLRQMADLAPGEGDHIDVTFTDTKKTGQPQPMKLYKVIVTPKALQQQATEPAPTEPSATAAGAEPDPF